MIIFRDVAVIRERHRRLSPSPKAISQSLQRIAALKVENMATATPAELDAIDITARLGIVTVNF